MRGTERLTSLVVPAYNPGPAVETAWRRLEPLLHRGPGAWEILFVCDGCTDGTPERLARLTALEGPLVRILTLTPNRGKGHAVRTGLREARGAYRLFTDVDLAYGPDDIVRVAEALRDGADVAVASRRHPESRVTLPPALLGHAHRRSVQGRLYGLLARLLLPIRQRDTQAGLKGLTERAAWLVLPHLKADGFSFDCELLTAAARYGLAIDEVPVHVTLESKASTAHSGCVFGMVRDLWRIRREWRAPPRPIAIPVATPERLAA